MTLPIKFMETSTPVEKLSKPVMERMDQKMRHYISRLRRANRCKSSEQHLKLNVYEVGDDRHMGISIIGERKNHLVTKSIEQGSQNLPFTVKGLHNAIKAVEVYLRNLKG